MSKIFTHLILFFHSIIYCSQPEKKRQENLFFACERAEVGLVFKLLDKGASLHYCHNNKNGCSDPSFLLRVFILNPENRAYIPQLLEKIGGMTPELLTRPALFQFPFFEWVIHYFGFEGTDERTAIEAFAEKTVSLEAIKIMASQAQRLIRENTDLPLAQLAFEKMQGRTKVLEIFEEQRLLNDGTPPRAAPTLVSISNFKI